MKIALVGFTNSYNDLRWLEMAEAWIASRDPQLHAAWPTAQRDVFDLRGEAGRNFLDDRGRYDVVVLFAIYNPPAQSPEFRRAMDRCRGQTSLAANHSRENWVNRLSSTNARYLFVFRRDDSIDGRWLGDIGVYRKSPETSGVFGVSIYERQPQREV